MITVIINTTLLFMNKLVDTMNPSFHCRKTDKGCQITLNKVFFSLLEKKTEPSPYY